MPPPLTETMYIRFATKQEARNTSANFWETVLGHPKRPEDVTEFIFPTLGCQDGGHDYMILTEPLFSQLYPKLTTQEKNFVDTNMVPASNVQVQNCIASLPRPLG
jgi:hypothetical protein